MVRKEFLKTWRTLLPESILPPDPWMVLGLLVDLGAMGSSIDAARNREFLCHQSRTYPCRDDEEAQKVKTLILTDSLQILGLYYSPSLFNSPNGRGIFFDYRRNICLNTFLELRPILVPVSKNISYNAKGGSSLVRFQLSERTRFWRSICVIGSI